MDLNSNRFRKLTIVHWEQVSTCIYRGPATNRPKNDFKKRQAQKPKYIFENKYIQKS